MKPILSMLDSLSDEYDELRFLPSRYEEPFVVWDNRLFLNLVYPERTTGSADKEPLFVLRLEVSKPGIQHVLDQLTHESEGQAYLAGNRSEWEISSSADGMPSKITRMA